MTLAHTTQPATNTQIKYLRDLIGKRDWQHHKWGEAFVTAVTTVREFIDAGHANEISKPSASKLIDELLRCRPIPQLPTTSTTLAEKIKVLAGLPLVKFALPRTDGSGIDFFEVVERKNGARFVNRLLGCPGDWNREKLSVIHQAAAGHAFSRDVKAAMDLYSDEFTVCSKCDAPLSDERSRAAKLGPVCAKNLGRAW